MRGVQIDFLIQTELSLCLVEVKRQKKIGREVIDEVMQKCKCLPRPRGMALRTALVYDGELAKSVVASGYFDAVVSSEELLGLAGGEGGNG